MASSEEAAVKRAGAENRRRARDRILGRSRLAWLSQPHTRRSRRGGDAAPLGVEVGFRDQVIAREGFADSWSVAPHRRCQGLASKV